MKNSEGEDWLTDWKEIKKGGGKAKKAKKPEAEEETETETGTETETADFREVN